MVFIDSRHKFHFIMLHSFHELLLFSFVFVCWEYVLIEVDLDDEIVYNLRREITIMRNFSHQNIVDYIDTFYLNNQIWLVMEYMANG
jgi:serine/threonine protein kinase